MSASNLDYIRLNHLSNRIKANTASKSERDEYMLSLYKNGNITKSQYDEYISTGNTSEEVLKAALTIGGVLLLAYLLTQLIDPKSK